MVLGFVPQIWPLCPHLSANSVQKPGSGHKRREHCCLCRVLGSPQMQWSQHPGTARWLGKINSWLKYNKTRLDNLVFFLN